jgi:ATP-dependent Clp protease ATP-binding subunit ClpC
VAGARRLLGRLNGGSAAPERGPARIAGLLAQRLHLLDCALAGLAVGEAGDAFLRVTADGDDPDAVLFAGRLAAMYRGWAQRRGMQLEELGPELLGVSGFGAWPLLRREAGLHTLERPRSGRGFDRVATRVVAAPQPDEPRAADAAGRRDQAERALAATVPRAAVVRRYREAPSPLVRDAAGWRTGRLDRVLAGDFDLFKA